MIVWKNIEEEYTLGKKIYHKEEFVTLAEWSKMKGSPMVEDDIRYAFHPVGINNKTGAITCVGRDYPNVFDFRQKTKIIGGRGRLSTRSCIIKSCYGRP